VIWFSRVCSLLLALVAFGCGEGVFRQEARSTLVKALDWYAARQVGGGWATQYSVDLRVRWGDFQPVPPDIVTIQQPGTPMDGTVYLRAYRVLGDKKYLETARKAGDLLVKGQHPEGGFSYELWLSPQGPRRVYQTRPMAEPMPFDRRGLSDGCTDSALQLLLALFDETGDSTYFKAAELGASFYVESQYPNGAWPMEYPPPETGYARYYTLNDGVVNDTICRLIDFYHRTGDRKYLEAALKGGRWLREAQMGPPTYGWAEQYDFQMNPAQARSWEVPAVCPRACGWAMEALLVLYLETGKMEFYEPVVRCVEWLEESQLARGIWSRNYDYRTGKPIYVDSRGRVHTDRNKAPGSPADGNFGLEPFLRDFHRLQEVGRIEFLRERNMPLIGKGRKERLAEMELKARIAVATLRPEGFWFDRGLIRSRTFFYNSLDLIDYLEGKRALSRRPRGICPRIRDYRY